MAYVISVVVVIFFLFNFYQDLVSRSIYLINLPLAALLLISYAWITHSFVSDTVYFLINIAIITIQVLGAWGFIKIFQNEKQGGFSNHIAFADIYFLFLPTIIFSPLQLIIFELVIFITSLIISAFIFLLVKVPKPVTVPLAGNISLGLALVVVLETFSHCAIREFFLTY